MYKTVLHFIESCFTFHTSASAGAEIVSVSKVAVVCELV